MIRHLDRFFKFTAAGSSLRTEVVAGLSTFAAMAYIICMQPALLSSAGMPQDALLTTTCLVAAFGSILMGLLANYPLGMAPGMGSNFIFVFGIIPACTAALGLRAGDPGGWHAALGVILLSGIIFLVISLTRFRAALLTTTSDSLKNAIAAGLGLFIGALGLRSGHIIRIEGNQVSLAVTFSDPAVTVFGVGLIITAAFMLRRWRGALLAGIGASVLTAILLGQVKFGGGVFGIPADPSPVLFKADILSALRYSFDLMPLILLCTFVALFDTMGAVIGVGSQAGLVRGRHIERDGRVFAADAIAVIGGALGGHSTVASYVESAAGVEAGGRTGLTAVVTGICFLLSLLLFPFIYAIASYGPATSAALVVVGALMFRSGVNVDWHDVSEAIPAFLIIAGIPLCNSVAEGIALGLGVYPFIKLLGGKGYKVSIFSYVLGFLLLLYLLFMLK